MRHGETCEGEHSILLVWKDFCWPGSRLCASGRFAKARFAKTKRLHVPGKHLLRIDYDKSPGTAGQDFAFFIFDLGRVDVPAAVHALLVGGYRERLP